MFFGKEVGIVVVLLLVLYDFVNVDIEVEVFYREGVEIFGVVGEGIVMEEDLNCFYWFVFYFLDLMLNNR